MSFISSFCLISRCDFKFFTQSLSFSACLPRLPTSFSSFVPCFFVLLLLHYYSPRISLSSLFIFFHLNGINPITTSQYLVSTPLPFSHLSMSSSWRGIWRPLLWSHTHLFASPCWPSSSLSWCSPASEASSPTPGASIPTQQRPCVCQSWCSCLESIRLNNR